MSRHAGRRPACGKLAAACHAVTPAFDAVIAGHGSH